MQRRQGLGDEEVETNSVEDNNKQSAIIEILYPINHTLFYNKTRAES